MRALARELAGGLVFIAIGVAVSLAVVLVQGAEASPDGPRISWVWRGMTPFYGQQCASWAGSPYQKPGWHECWHDDEAGDYTAIDYNRGAQTAGSGVWLDYDGDFELFKIEEYADTCTGVRAKIYWGSYDEANYKGDIHYLHIDPNELWIGEEVPYQAIYIGDVLSEEKQGCWWEGPHLHQSANVSMTSPFCSNKFVDPSQGENWQHKVFWLSEYTDDTDCDRWIDDWEDHIGTDPEDDCTDNPGDADAWPPDINRDTWADVLDVLMFKPKFTGWGYPYDARYDIMVDGEVDILDVLMYKPVMGMRCTP